jgi:hypothetical protein
MGNSNYNVVKDTNKWTISAAGADVITCRDRKTAIKTARRAAELLREFETAGDASPRYAGPKSDSDDAT